MYRLEVVDLSEIYYVSYISVSFRGRAGIFSLCHRIQTHSETHPTSYPVGSGGSFPGRKAAGVRKSPLTSI
jgi:hypothetical protein